MESLSVDGLEARPLSPELPVGNNGGGHGGTQLFFVSKDAVGIIGSERSRGNTSEPRNEVEVVLTGLRATKETTRGKLGRDGSEDQVVDVGGVTGGGLEEALLGLFGDFVLVGLQETPVSRDLFVVEGLELGSFRGGGDTFEGSLT